MWGANFTGVPVGGLSGLVHDGDTVTIQQQQHQQQQSPKLPSGKCQERISQ